MLVERHHDHGGDGEGAEERDHIRGPEPPIGIEGGQKQAQRHGGVGRIDEKERFGRRDSVSQRADDRLGENRHEDTIAIGRGGRASEDLLMERLPLVHERAVNLSEVQMREARRGGQQENRDASR